MFRFVVLFTFTLFSASAFSDGDSAPSSHMVYNDASFNGDILINEVRVPKDGVAMYTYYEALGWSGKAGGYAGIQEHPRARNFIFSIWDHKEHTAPIKAVYHGPGTETKKFGGEGAGLKSWNFELGWDVDVWYTLVARCWPVGDHTFYGYWVRDGKTKRWTHLVTMDVAAKDARLRGGNDSFIEDWLATGKQARTTHLRNGWKRKPDGEWHAFGKARYSVNHWDLVEGKRSFNFRTNWDGGIGEDKTGQFYYMISGGADTKANTKNPSEFKIDRVEKKPGYAPIKIKSAKITDREGRKISVQWELDPTSAPQFEYALEVFEKSKPEGEALVEVRKTEPHVRSAQIELPEGVRYESIKLKLECLDIFDSRSELVLVGVLGGNGN